MATVYTHFTTTSRGILSAFQLGADVHTNVAELLRALGSVKRPLSYGDLAALLNERDASRRRYPSTIQKWIEGVVPDLRSIKLMAELADVTFEQFALGAGAHATETPRSANALAAAMEAGAQSPRGAQLEPKDVPAADPRKKPEAGQEKGKRAG